MKRICKDQNLADLHPEIQSLWNTRKKEPETQVFNWGMDPWEPPDIEDMEEAQRLVAIGMENMLDRQAAVLRMRFWGDMTLEQVAKAMNVSGERVRQLEGHGMRRMRQIIRHAQLQEDPFMDLKHKYEIWRTQQNPRRIRVSTP
jgi:RNA polymerase sigma factor (sigma-70 family)